MPRKKKSEKSEDEHDLEEEWKKLRERLRRGLGKEKEEKEESELEQAVEESAEEMGSEQFTEFMQAPMNTPAEIVSPPVLERVESEQEQPVNLETLGQDIPGFQATTGQETEEPAFPTAENEPEYIMGMENLYRQSQIDVRPPVLTPRDTMPPEEIPRHELMDPRLAMAGRRIRGEIYPELLEEEGKDEKYYKIVK